MEKDGPTSFQRKTESPEMNIGKYGSGEYQQVAKLGISPMFLFFALVPIWDYTIFMRIIALPTLKNFWETSSYADAKEPLLAWYRVVLKADWKSPAEIKADLRNASILQDGRTIFNIAGNKYRLAVWINYSYRVVHVRFVGTHAQYDAIDPQAI